MLNLTPSGVKLTPTGVKINTNLVWTSHNTGGVEFNTGVFAVFPSLLLWRPFSFPFFLSLSLLLSFSPLLFGAPLRPRGASASYAPPRIRHCVKRIRHNTRILPGDVSSDFWFPGVEQRSLRKEIVVEM